MRERNGRTENVLDHKVKGSYFMKYTNFIVAICKTD